MRLTRRGWSVVVLVLAAVGMGGVFGARGLNAIVAPGVVGLVAGVVQVLWVARPVVTREVPARGGVGESIQVRVGVAGGSLVSVVVADQVSDGLGASGNQVVVPGSGLVEYTVRLLARGERTIGPVQVTVRDLFGLVESSFTAAVVDMILVHPRVYELEDDRGQSVVDQFGLIGSQRDQFDQVRVYQRGDPLRDIHWKSSAKHPGLELVVKEFASADSEQPVWVEGSAAPGCDDGMAVAVGSVALALVRAGIPVGVETPDGVIGPGVGSDHGRRILDHLAVVGAGEPAGEHVSVIQIGAIESGVRVGFAGHEYAFRDLVGRAAGTDPWWQGVTEQRVGRGVA